MKTAHMTIDEKKATITITNIEELTKAEWRIFESYKDAGFKVRNKRKVGKNAMHKKSYYLEKLANDVAAQAEFETICATQSFAKATKWFRDEYETGKFAEKKSAKVVSLTAVA